MDYYELRKYIFKLDPETAHGAVEFLLESAGFFPFVLNYLKKKFCVEDERLSQRIWDRDFKNPVGLGAGFDKNATMIKGFYALGFGFTEVGTVTLKPQSGNPKPRLFRYPKYESLQNAMGFNNDGAEVIKERVKRLYPFEIPIGVNIGKNKTTPQDRAIEDYEELIKTFKEVCDFLVVNVSSPNTPNLRDLQNEEFIKELFKRAKAVTDKPVLLKLAPDMEIDTALSLCQTAINSFADGIIATNTTMDYSLLPGAKDFGGISGKALKEKSFVFFEEIAKHFYKQTVLISVGGIDGAKEAIRRLRAGANLIEIFTALVFKGPSLAKEINEGILKELDREGLKNIQELIGTDRE